MASYISENWFFFILSSILAILTTAWGIRKGRSLSKGGELTFFQRNYFPLFKNNIREIEGLSISLDGNVINENLFLIKFSIANTGTIDFDQSSIHKPLEIILDKKYHWKKANITNEDKYETHIKITENILTIEWSLLKVSELINFNAVIENIEPLEDKESAIEKIKFRHRITHLKDVLKMEVTPPQGLSNKYPYLIPTLTGIFSIVFGVMSIYSYLNKKDGTITNTYFIEGKSHITYTDVTVSNNNIKLISELRDTIIPRSEIGTIKSNSTIKPITKMEFINFILSLMVVFVVLVNNLLSFIVAQQRSRTNSILAKFSI
ncbi:hypothetical protein BH09BAC1_BH09BAC1_23700 [soil metagenome]